MRMIYLEKLAESFFTWHTDLSGLKETELTEDVQLAVLAATLAAPTCAAFPPHLDFRLAFCKKLIKWVESRGGEAVEQLYEQLAQLQQEQLAEKLGKEQLVTSTAAYRTYFIDSCSVSLRETQEIIR
jgi:hypothetical protein